MKLLSVITTLGLAVSAFAVPSLLFSNVTRAYSDPEAYQVYSAALPVNTAYRSASTVIFRGETMSYSKFFLPHGLTECVDPAPTYKALVAPAIADYERVNRLHWKLTRLFPISKPYELAPATDFGGSWFYKTSSPLGEYIRNHPDLPGFIELSAVGFNGAKTIAVVYMSYKGGNLGSGWDVVVLRKQNGQWKQIVGKGFGCFAKS